MTNKDWIVDPPIAQAVSAVPREPTQAMLDAAFYVYNDNMTCKNIWRAMYDAAVSTPAASEAATPGVREAHPQPHATAGTLISNATSDDGIAGHKDWIVDPPTAQAVSAEDAELCRRVRGGYDGNKAAARIEELSRQLAEVMDCDRRNEMDAYERAERAEAQLAEVEATMVRHSGHASGLIDKANTRAEAAEAECAQLRAALVNARDALYNGFEPDNQSRAWHAADAALAASTQTRAEE